MSKKPKSIEEIRNDFRKSMQKIANKSGSTITFSTREHGVEKKLGEIKPQKP